MQVVRTKLSSIRIAASVILVSLTGPGYSEVVAGSDLSRGDMETTLPRHLMVCSYRDDALDPDEVRKHQQEKGKIISVV